MLGLRWQRLKALLNQNKADNKVYVETAAPLTIEDVTKEPNEQVVVQPLGQVIIKEVVVHEEPEKELPPLSESAIQNLICPISMEIMRDPVTNRDGYTFEREAITGWLKSKHTCPISRNPMCQADLIPNKSLKKTIMWYRHHKLLPPILSKISDEQDDQETSTYNSGQLPPIDIPEYPDLSFLGRSDRPMIESAYYVMNRLRAWDYMRRYSPTRHTGYTFDPDLAINRIMNEIQHEYDLHSGGSMGYTMRRIEFIAKNGLSVFRQQYMEASYN